MILPQAWKTAVVSAVVDFKFDNLNAGPDHVLVAAHVLLEASPRKEVIYARRPRLDMSMIHDSDTPHIK